MKTLKEYIDYQYITGWSDEEIVLAYFVDNDMEEKAMELYYNLAKAKIEKMKLQIYTIKNWTYNLPSNYLYENYSLEIASWLHRVELDFIVNGEVTSRRLEWAKENIPNIELPEVYFFPCVDWLKENGIKFKETKEKGYTYYDET